MVKESAVLQKKEELIKDVFMLTFKATEIKSLAKAGQFVNISLNDGIHLLRRPFGIAKVTDDGFSIVFKVLGDGTKILKEAKVGAIFDILGPLGNGFPVFENKKALIVGGGLGLPPLAFLENSLKNSCVYLGFQSEKDVFGKELFNSGVEIATADGSMGFKGNVIELINSLEPEFDILYACGPLKMLEALDKKFFGKVEGYLSYEERMACGFGVCYGCTILNNKKEMVRVCKEGPVFKLGEISHE